MGLTAIARLISFAFTCAGIWLALATPLYAAGAVQSSVETPEALYNRALEILSVAASPDYAEAARLTRQAADRGLPAAQRTLGELYFSGRGVARNPAEAARWFEKAAEAGDSWAQSNLGYMYAEGLGIGKDEKRALQWLQRASDAGDAAGQYYLASLYARGFGVARSPEAAMQGYHKAAEQGFALAQLALGIAYEVGFGGREMSLDEAVKWYSRAAVNGVEAAKAPLQELAPHVAPAPSATDVAGGQPRTLPPADAQASLIESPRPSYPSAARAARVQGTVILQGVINRLGRIRSLRLIRGEPFLNEAAMDAVRRWRYTPQLVDGQAIEVITMITVNFSFQ